MLPTEIWQHISDFLESGILSHVCKALWLQLRGRHLRLHVKTEDLVPLVLRQRRSTIRTLRVKSKVRLKHDAAKALASLSNAPALYSMSLDFAKTNMGLCGAQALSALRGTSSLHVLHLDLSCNHIRSGWF